jgi:hypothetical protein
VASVENLDNYSGIKPVGAVLVDDEGIEYACASATVEHRPTGISASMATVRLECLIDIDSIQPYPEFADAESPTITPPRNLEFAVLRGSENFVNGTAPAYQGNEQYITLPSEDGDKALKEARKSQKNEKNNVLKLSELLESHFSIKIGAGFVQVGKPASEQIYREMVFSDMLVKYVNGLDEYPMALNKRCIVEVVLFDRRDRWALLSNFSDQINRTKGVDNEGNVGYYNETCFNPFAPQNERRYWNATDLFSYLVHLIEGVELKGSRGAGFEFDEGLVGSKIANDLNLGNNGETVDDLEVYGGNPAQILDQFLSRWGCTLIFPHTGAWYIEKTDKTAVYPNEGVYKYSSGITSHNFNPISLRAKELVVYGPDAQYQEGFNGMTQGTDFEYVVPYFGQWVELGQAWFICKQSRNGTVNLDSAPIQTLTADEWSRLALLSAVPTGDDYEAYFFEAAADGDISIEVARLIIAVAENGFKFIRLLRDGDYGKTRKPLPNLLSVDSVGDSNRPVIIADSWASADVRASVNVPYSDWDELTGAAPARFFEEGEIVDAELTKNGVANKNKQVRVLNYSQGMTLVDSEALVFSFAKKLIYPTGPRSVGSDGFEIRQEFRPSDATQQPTTRRTTPRDTPRNTIDPNARDGSIVGLAGGEVISERAQEYLERLANQQITEPAKIIDMLDVYKNGGLNRNRTNALIQMYTDQDWARTQSINILVGSYIPVGLAKDGASVVSLSAYQKRYTVNDGWEGTAYRYMDFLESKFIIAKQAVGTRAIGNGEFAQTYEIVPTYESTDEGSTAYPQIRLLNGPNPVFGIGPIEVLRQLADSGASPFSSYFKKLDQHCDRFAADYFNRLRHKLGVDYTFVGIRVPAGGAVIEEDMDAEGQFIYSPALSTVMWHVDDEGAFTMARYNNPEAFTPFVSQYERQYVDYLNQQRQFNDVTSLSDFAKQVRKMSAGRHIE